MNKIQIGNKLIGDGELASLIAELYKHMMAH